MKLTFAIAILSTHFLNACGVQNGGSEISAAPKVTLPINSKNCPINLVCYTMKLPLNYASTSGKKIPVTFAVHPAQKVRKGALLLVFGGPGDSGVSGLRDWLPTFDKKLMESYDLVTFDLRGTHRSGNLNCPKAYGDFIFVPTMASSQEERAALKAGAAKFAKACPEEMGISAADLPYYNTHEAIHDVNAFREAMGYKTFTVHAMSYGTQFTQHYATRYPEQLDAIVLDGAVDMNANLLEYEIDLTDAENDVLDQSFAACESDANCSALFSKRIEPELNIGAIYDRLRARLQNGPASVMVDGKTVQFGLYDFEYTAANSVGRPESRSDFLRALGAASGPKADFSLMLRLANGESLAPVKDKTTKAKSKPIDESFAGMSNGIFYAFICNDYGMAETRPAERIQSFFDNARSRESSVRIRNALYGETPCAYWSSTGSNVGANETHIAASIPTIVVNSTADANVPSKHGFAVADSLENGALIEVKGGKHIMYGYKVACIDKPVTNFLLTHKLPENRHIECSDKLIAPIGK